MFSFSKKYKKILNVRAFILKGANRFLLPIFFVICGVFFTSNSIRAQIQNLYDAQSDDVAGINSLMTAVANNDVAGVRFFSKAGPALINQQNFGGATALHLACREGNAEIAQILVEGGADVNATDNEGWTPLMRASLAANNKIVELLLSRDAQANKINSVNESAIIHATISDCNDCLNLMFAKFNFIRSMDIRVLKEQLTDAFVIARNRENSAAQGIIESYLDQVIKASPLIQKENDEKAAQAEPAEKTFKIISDEKVVATTKSTTPMILKKKEERVVVQKPVAKITEKIPTIKTEEKKFKFIPNAPAKDCDCDEKSAKSTASKLESSNKEVIFLIKKDQETKSTNSASSDKIFKFNKGPEGKITKTIFKPKVEIKPSPKPANTTEKPQEKISISKEKTPKIETTPAITAPKTDEKKIEADKTQLKPTTPQATTTAPKPAAIPTEIIPNSLSRVTPKFVIGVLPPDDPRAKALEASKNK